MNHTDHVMERCTIGKRVHMENEEIIVGGRYLILKDVGKGTTGRVFKAKDISNSKIVALKEFVTSDPKNKQQLAKDVQKELNVLKYTTHPVLPTIYNIIMDKDKFFLVMEYVEGTNLKQYVDCNGVVSQKELKSIMEQVCCGLYYLHSLNPPIVYRDLKPANIILKKDGTIKLIDFGIAKRYNKEMKSDYRALGTKGFAAPEQFGNRDGLGIYNTDIRSDIYGIGTTMSYLVTGKIFDLNKRSIMINCDVWKIIKKCTKIKMDERYQNCIDVICDLRKSRNSLFLTVLYPGIKRMSKHKILH